jgi:hypothetical protein
VGEKGTPLSPYLQLPSDQQQRPISPALLRLAHPCHAQKGKKSRISSHPEAPAPPPPRHLGLHPRGRSGLRPFLWIWDQWGSLKGAWALLCGSREGGGVCPACGAQDRGCAAWGGVARDPCRRRLVSLFLRSFWFIVDQVVQPPLIVADGAKGSVGALDDVYVRLGTEPPRCLPVASVAPACVRLPDAACDMERTPRFAGKLSPPAATPPVGGSLPIDLFQGPLAYTKIAADSRHR